MIKGGSFFGEDGGYIIAGFSDFADGDVTGNHGGYDYWIIKLSAETVVVAENNLNKALEIYPNPTNDIINVVINNFKNITITI